MKAEKKTLSFTLVIVIGVIFVIGATAGIIFANKAAAERVRSVRETPQRVYHPGESVNINDNEQIITYRLSENNSVELSFTNNGSDIWKPRLVFSGIKILEKVEIPYKDGTDSAYVADMYTLTNKSNDFPTEDPHSFVLRDALKISVDAKEADDCIIPPDGKEYTIVVDYGYFNDNNIEIDNSFTVDMFSFIL